MVNIGGTNTGNERRGLSFLVFVGIIGFSIARAIATFFTNYLWFDSVDLNSVWIKILLTKSILVAATSLLALAIENPIIPTKTRKDKPLLSLPVFVPPILTMFIYYLSLVFNVNYTAK